MSYLWFFLCCARGRSVDRFYLYLGLGQFLVPQESVFSELPSPNSKEV